MQRPTKVRTDILVACAACFMALLLLTHAANAQVLTPERDMRGVWIATVSNIDWPSKRGLTPEQQRSEFVRLLDYHRTYGINAVFVQVRPAADAFFHSTLEPWSAYLTGTLGKAPEPFYDPLVFMIEEAHARGIAFHAWLNPYRGSMSTHDSLRLHPAGLILQHPEWFVRYGKNFYFNPALPEVRQHVTNVATDIASRYEVDGIHFDDYFYPYKIAGEVFPDSMEFAEDPRGFASIDDWRRDNVNLLIQKLGDTLRALKPHLQFGVSPFSVWRNKTTDPLGSDSQGGQTCYDDLFADVRKWLQEGWIDYVVPQLYFNIGHPKVEYATMVKWWTQHNFGKPIFIGQGAYRVNAEKDSLWRDPRQLFHQLRLNDQYAEVKGSIYFSSRSMVNNVLGITDSLRRDQYRIPAIVPAHASAPTETKRTDYVLRFRPGKALTVAWQGDPTETLHPATPYVIFRAPVNKRGSNDTLKFSQLAVVTPKKHNVAGLQTYVDNQARRRRVYAYAVIAVDAFGRHSQAAQAYTVKYRRRKAVEMSPVILHVP